MKQCTECGKNCYESNIGYCYSCLKHLCGSCIVKDGDGGAFARTAGMTIKMKNARGRKVNNS